MGFVMAKMTRTLVGAGATAAVVGSGLAGIAWAPQESAPLVMRAPRVTSSPVSTPAETSTIVADSGESTACTAWIYAFEDGSWSGQEVTVTDVTGESMRVADFFVVQPAPGGSFLTTQDGTRTLRTQWPVEYGGTFCTVQAHTAADAF